MHIRLHAYVNVTMSTLELLLALIKKHSADGEGGNQDDTQRAVFLKEFRHRVVHSSNGELVFHIFRAADKTSCRYKRNFSARRPACA